MKIKIKPVLNPLTGETCASVEVFDPRVLPARPAIPAIEENKEAGIAAWRGEPAYLGTISCIVRFYDANGGTIGKPLRDDRTALTDEQFAKWDASVDDDTEFFAECVLANLGLSRA